MRGGVLVLTILVGLAGCFAAPSTPPTDDRIGNLPREYSRDYPRLVCLDGANVTIFSDWGRNSTGCNYNMSPQNVGNEVTIAVNPKDDKNVLGGAKDYTQPAAGQCVWDGIYTTKDKGQSWTNQQLPGSNWARASRPSEPVTPLSKHWCATDPVVAFGPDGSAYYAAMGYQCDPVSASRTGEGTLPDGGLNDWAFNCSQMYVLKSTDGGVTWPSDLIIPLEPVGAYPLAFHDREWIEVGKTGTVHVGWVSFDGNWVYRSIDGGKKFEGPVILPNSGGQGTMIATGPKGEVYVSWNCAAKTSLAVSLNDGATWAGPLEVPTHCEDSVLYPSDAYPRGEPRTGDPPFPAVDDSDGPYAGSIYFVSRTAKFGGQDIGFTRSTDQGKTWTALRQLNDDNGTDTAHFYAAISVNPHGVVDVVWLDQRNDANHHDYDLYYTYSLDGGTTWAPNARVSEVMSDPKHSHHQNGMIFIGDYIDIDSSERYAHPVWVDTRNQEADVFTAWIERPSFPIGHAGAGSV